jgi:hypothetical protein
MHGAVTRIGQMRNENRMVGELGHKRPFTILMLREDDMLRQEDNVIMVHKAIACDGVYVTSFG